MTIMRETGEKGPSPAPMVDKFRRAQAAQPEPAPEGEQEFLDWLNAKKRAPAKGYGIHPSSNAA